MGNDSNRTNKHRRKINEKNIKRYARGGGVSRKLQPGGQCGALLDWYCGDVEPISLSRGRCMCECENCGWVSTYKGYGDMWCGWSQFSDRWCHLDDECEHQCQNLCQTCGSESNIQM